MSDDSGKMPEQFIDRPGPPFVQLKVKDLKPEHGEGFIGVDDVAVDTNRQCWVLLDAPVFGADFRDVAPLILRRTPDAGYEIQMGGLPTESNFTLIPSPDDSTWVRVKVVEAPGSEGTSSGRVIPG
jgi:hypothetical protein